MLTGNREWAITNEKSVSGGIAGVKYEGDCESTVSDQLACFLCN